MREPYIFANRYSDDLEEQLEKRPKCSCCGEHIQEDECIQLPDGKIYCSECEFENARTFWLEFGREMYAVNTDEVE